MMNSMLTAFSLANAYLRERPLATFLNIVLLGLGVGTIIALMLTLSQAEERMERDTAGIDLVIGAKGSPLQLILSSVFHVDIPTGNIPLAEAKPIISLPQVRRAIPLALGDSYKTFRIVGTEPEYLHLYGANLQSGVMWAKPLEAIVGAEVARATQLKVGQSFAGAHGLSESGDTSGNTHADHPYQVVGVMAPTGSVIDRLVLTSLDSIWLVHEHEDADEAKSNGKDKHHVEPATLNTIAEKNLAGQVRAQVIHDHEPSREVTAYLIEYATPLAAASFPRMVNASSSMQAAAPAMETARLFSLIGVGVTTLKVFAGIMMVCAALGIFIGLMNTLNDRQADLALLRVLGASRGTVCLTIMAQGFALGLAGVILGVALGHLGGEWMGQAIGKTHRIPLTGWTWVAEEWWIMGAAMLLSVVAALFPAWRAYRDAVPETLSRA